MEHSCFTENSFLEFTIATNSSILLKCTVPSVLSPFPLPDLYLTHNPERRCYPLGSSALYTTEDEESVSITDLRGGCYSLN